MNSDWQIKYHKIKLIFDSARQEIAALRIKKRQTIEQIKKEDDLIKADQIRSKIRNL